MNEKVKATYGNKTRVRVCGICVQRNSILLVRHKGLGKKGILWSPPGGGVHYMESVTDALVREFKEETGLTVAVEELLFVNEYREDPLHAIELFFNVKQLGGTVSKGYDPEHAANEQLVDEVRFVTFQELSIMNTDTVHNILANITNEETILNMRGYFHFSP